MQSKQKNKYVDRKGCSIKKMRVLEEHKYNVLLSDKRQQLCREIVRKKPATIEVRYIRITSEQLYSHLTYIRSVEYLRRQTGCLDWRHDAISTKILRVFLLGSCIW